MKRIESLSKGCELIEINEGEYLSIPGKIYGDFGNYISKVGVDVYRVNESVYAIAETVELYGHKIIANVHDAVSTEIALDELDIEYKE